MREKISSVDLQRFAQQLSAVNDDLKTQRNGINGKFNDLGQSWKDPHYQQMARLFEECIANLDGYLKSGDQFLSFLERKARKVRAAEDFSY